MRMTNCPDCGVKPGQHHNPGCDVEQCPYCGSQLLFCPCEHKPPLDDRMPWTGLWPGVAECREFGWYTRRVPGKGSVGGGNVSGGREDLNRLGEEARWDRLNKRYVLPRE